MDPDDDPKSLGTDVRPSKTINKTAPRGSKELESFLDALQREVFHNLRLNPRTSDLSQRVHSLLHQLRRDDCDLVPIPTDKTNSFRLVKVEDYIGWMIEKIASMDAQEIDIAALQTAHEAAETFATTINGLYEQGVHFPISDTELNAITHCLSKRSVPTPFLLLKDHKPASATGQYPTRLVLPATGFNSMFAKVGYKAIKHIFDMRNVGYGSRTILNAAHLKSRLEQMDIRHSTCSIFSLDIVDFYPSITFDLVKQAITFYSSQVHLTQDDQTVISHSLDLIAHALEGQYFTFHDKYYRYGGQHAMDSPSLSIGGYESAWLADLVASYFFDALEDRFVNIMQYWGIYRDDGLVVTTVPWPDADINKWLHDFQIAVDSLLHGGWHPNCQCPV